MSTPDLSSLRIQREAFDPDRPRPVRKALMWTGALVVILAVAGFLLWRSELLPTAAPEVRVARVRVVQAGNVEEVLTATGYIVPQRRSVVSARTSGRLEWLGVDEGSRVTRGEIVARLDNEDLAAMVTESKASLSQARATLAQSRAALWEAEREQERQQNLLGQGITTQAAHDAARRGLDVARSGLEANEHAVRAATARVELAEANFEKTNVRAPFDGIVISKNSE